LKNQTPVEPLKLSPSERKNRVAK